MQLFEKDSARLTAEYGITVGRWEQYLGTEGKLPFGAMWSIVPPGGVAAAPPPAAVAPAVDLCGDGVAASTGTGDRRPTPVGTAALMDSYERHVWHNRSADAPLVFLSIYWMPLDQPA